MQNSETIDEEGEQRQTESRTDTNNIEKVCNITIIYLYRRTTRGKNCKSKDVLKQKQLFF